MADSKIRVCRDVHMDMIYIEDCCEILDSMRVPITASDREEGEYPYYGANGIQDHVANYIFDDDLVLLAEDGGNFGSRERPIAYRVSGKCWVNNHAHVLKPKKGLDVDYLCYSLMFYKIDGMVNGATRKKLTQAAMRKMKIPMRSINEQLHIVAELNHILKIKEQQQYELTLFNKLIKARFVELFGDPVMNEKGWITKSLLDMGRCKNGMNFHYDDEGVEINCLGVGDFKELSIIDNTDELPTVSLKEMPSEEYLLKDDDIVFVRSNGNKALVGRSIAVYPGNVPTTFSGFCIRYRKYDNEIIVPYLLRALKVDSMRMKVTGRGANIQNLNQQILGTLVIPVPPIELQNQFADFVKQVDKSKVKVQKALDETQKLFDSLMQQYFG
ncbi:MULTISPECIES: restriction endonuclease subunit S [unclassified Blautia]|uniref:restriction endonuclease subunit S n=1 Tax=unclassified Blautia TaxID=2648079 RepID=UPI001FD4E33D|nr:MULTISPECIES: restriction endonuclease subunit S [unclassified Blautia]MCJ7861919.1 restriction endonuclease subunit S [Blautia sp. NSJ-157]MCJ7865262.1 restriction endonuclease subunit S [Blautia sp. NSJ-140]